MDIYEAVGMCEFSYYLSHARITADSSRFSRAFPAGAQDITAGSGNPEAVAYRRGGHDLRQRRRSRPVPGILELPEETRKPDMTAASSLATTQRYDEDGYIWFIGRKDDIINSFGYRVSPYEIERVLKSHPAVADCASVGEEIEKDKVLVVAYVIMRPGSTTTADELLVFGRKHLAAYKAPKTIYIAKDFPRTKNGKILRKDVNPTIATSRSSIR